MKHVEGCLSAREYRESSFHSCGGTVSPVQACLCEGKTRFNLRGSAVKHVEASVRPRAYRQSRFHRCGGPVRFGARLFICGKDLITPF